MSAETPTETQNNPMILTLGCDPQVKVTVYEDDGNLVFFLTDADGVDPADIDGIFFNLTDDSHLGDLVVYPDVNDLEVTGYQAEADSVDSLSNGATLADQYDAAIQFGMADDSTEGELNTVAFTLWSHGEPLTFDSIDFSELAIVVDSDTGDGQVLTVNDDPDSETDVDPTTCTFLIEGGDVEVEVMLSELENGDMQVDLEVLSGGENGGNIADIRGLFFDVGDNSLLSDLSISGADVTNSEISEESLTNLGGGNNMNGVADGFDVGLSIGTSGMGKDDIQSTSFTLSHPEGLSLEDFEGQFFGLRLTSVGEEDGARDGSLKLLGTCTNDGDPVCDAQYALSDIMDLMTIFSDEELENEFSAADQEEDLTQLVA